MYNTILSPDSDSSVPNPLLISLFGNKLLTYISQCQQLNFFVSLGFSTGSGLRKQAAAHGAGLRIAVSVTGVFLYHR